MMDIPKKHMASIEPQKCFGLPEGQDARFLADTARALSRTRQVLCHIALDDVRLSSLQELLTFFAPDIDVILFPSWDCLPYDRVSPHTDIMGARVTALARLLEWSSDELYKPRILLTTVNATIQRVMPPSVLQSSQLVARKGKRLNDQDL
ncbi:MAG: hypothetical protein AAB276_09925, partial [Pseudomonadota bacterium]